MVSMQIIVSIASFMLVIAEGSFSLGLNGMGEVINPPYFDGKTTSEESLKPVDTRDMSLSNIEGEPRETQRKRGSNKNTTDFRENPNRGLRRLQDDVFEAQRFTWYSSPIEGDDSVFFSEAQMCVDDGRSDLLGVYVPAEDANDVDKFFLWFSDDSLAMVYLCHRGVPMFALTIGKDVVFNQNFGNFNVATLNAAYGATATKTPFTLLEVPSDYDTMDHELHYRDYTDPAMGGLSIIAELGQCGRSSSHLRMGVTTPDLIDQGRLAWDATDSRVYVTSFKVIPEFTTEDEHAAVPLVLCWSYNNGAVTAPIIFDDPGLPRLQKTDLSMLSLYAPDLTRTSTYTEVEDAVVTMTGTNGMYAGSFLVKDLTLDADYTTPPAPQFVFLTTSFPHPLYVNWRTPEANEKSIIVSTSELESDASNLGLSVEYRDADFPDGQSLFSRHGEGYVLSVQFGDSTAKFLMPAYYHYCITPTGAAFPQAFMLPTVDGMGLIVAHNPDPVRMAFMEELKDSTADTTLMLHCLGNRAVDSTSTATSMSMPYGDPLFVCPAVDNSDDPAFNVNMFEPGSAPAKGGAIRRLPRISTGDVNNFVIYRLCEEELVCPASSWTSTTPIYPLYLNLASPITPLAVSEPVPPQQ